MSLAELIIGVVIVALIAMSMPKSRAFILGMLAILALIFVGYRFAEIPRPIMASLGTETAVPTKLPKTLHTPIEQESSATPTKTVKEYAENSVESSRPSDAPAWVGKAPHWENGVVNGVYIVPVASEFSEDEPFNGENDAEWEKRMDEAAIAELPNAVHTRALNPKQNYWEGLYELIKFRAWGEERYVEKITIAISPRPRYQLHGVLRISPEVRRLLASKHLDLQISSPIAATAMPREPHSAHSRNSSGTPSVMLLALVIIGGLFIGQLLVNPRARGSALKVLAIGAAFAGILLGLWCIRVYRDFGGVPCIEWFNASSNSKNSRPTILEATDLAPVSVPTTTGEKPDWVDKPNRLEGTSYHSSVKSGLFVTVPECERALNAKVRTAVEEYVDELIGPHAVAKIPVDASLLARVQKTRYQETVTSSTVGPMQQVHAKLEFDDAVIKELTARWRNTISQERLSRMAFGAGILLAVLAIVFGYLKFDLATGGQSRNRLRAAAIAAILLVAATAVFASLVG